MGHDEINVSSSVFSALCCESSEDCLAQRTNSLRLTYFLRRRRQKRKENEVKSLSSSMSSPMFRRSMPDWVVSVELRHHFSKTFPEKFVTTTNWLFFFASLARVSLVGPNKSHRSPTASAAHSTRSRLRSHRLFRTASYSERRSKATVERCHATELCGSWSKVWTVRDNRSRRQMWAVREESVLLLVRWQVPSSPEATESSEKSM